MIRMTSITILQLPVGQMAANCYLVGNKQTGQAIVIDPGDDAQFIVDKLRLLGFTPVVLVATHGHFDHIMAAFELQRTFDIPFLIHRDDAFLVARLVESAERFLGLRVSDPPPRISKTIVDQEVLLYGGISLTVMHTPGHTPGSVCLVLGGQNALFVGDTIFANGGVGRTDFHYSNTHNLMASLETILSFDGDTVLYPGHGETTIVADEKPFHARDYV